LSADCQRLRKFSATWLITVVAQAIAVIVFCASPAGASEGLLYFSLYVADADAYNQAAVERCKEQGLVVSSKLDAGLAKWREVNKVASERARKETLEAASTEQGNEQANELRTTLPARVRELHEKTFMAEKTPGSTCAALVEMLNADKKDWALTIVENEQRKAMKK
jgi:hypothetical protein